MTILSIYSYNYFRLSDPTVSVSLSPLFLSFVRSHLGYNHQKYICTYVLLRNLRSPQPKTSDDLIQRTIIHISNCSILIFSQVDFVKVWCSIYSISSAISFLAWCDISRTSAEHNFSYFSNPQNLNTSFGRI